MYNPTPDEVVQFWEAMAARYGTRTIEKSRAPLMRATARVLDLAGVLPHRRFMERYTTVWGRTIYTPFVVGAAANDDARWAQIVVCTHEHQHVVQYARDGFAPYAARYVASRRHRALFEAEAYTCNVELHFWRHHALPDLTELAGRLRDYGCRPADIDAARTQLERAAAAIERGDTLTEAGRLAITLLERARA